MNDETCNTSSFEVEDDYLDFPIEFLFLWMEDLNAVSASEKDKKSVYTGLLNYSRVFNIPVEDTDLLFNRITLMLEKNHRFSEGDYKSLIPFILETPSYFVEVCLRLKLIPDNKVLTKNLSAFQALMDNYKLVTSDVIPEFCKVLSELKKREG